MRFYALLLSESIRPSRDCGAQAMAPELQSNNGRAYKGRKRTSVPFTFMEQTFPLWNT